ncbi:protease inhibitor I42 family protein [Actinomyces slackii]|nr:protease inhibitor I42 family protein [Actinomyces slackii]
MPHAPSRRRALAVACAAPLLAVSGCELLSGAQTATRSSGTPTATRSSGTRIVPREEPTCPTEGEDRVQVSLEANHTTPYEWRYTMSTDGVLEEDCSEYLTDEHEEGMTGVGGTMIFVFRAVADGEVTITFTYASLFDDDASSSPTEPSTSPTEDAEASPQDSDDEVVYTYRVRNGVISSV